MIWLKKVRKNALPDKDFNIAVYLQEMLEPFDKYLASIKGTELTPEIIQDAQFHLYQLMELYIDSRICSRWVTLNPDEKIKFFKNFSREKKLSELLFFGFDYFSNSDFYKLCAEEAILNFIQLGFYIFGDTAKSKTDINNLKNELQDLRKIVDENQQDIYNLTEAFENWRKKVSTPKEIITKEEMIANLHENPYYNSIVLVVPDFEKYCDFLLKNELLTYNGSCLCRTDNWPKYYYSNLLYDPFVKLLEV